MTETAPVPAELILPKDASALLEKVDHQRRHPGLQLDKLSPPCKEEVQKKHEVEKVCQAAGAPGLLSALWKRRESMLSAIGAERFRATTAGSLTLHLARASGLENAGIHLHPVYGFACLPGSGLKGMTRAYAETVWLADQSDRVAAWNDIRTVFGWAAGSEQDKHWKPDGLGEPDGSVAGAVVFHDAWPLEWPCLLPDIVNNHHKQYYEGEEDPGDWENPEMAYFLSVVADTTFDFAVSPRTAGDGGKPGHMALAREWLQAALVHAGAGAKTNAGYGRFRLEGQPGPAPPSTARAVSTHTLELATPAFLAGAMQQRDDCDLRPATLRGLLRWWWRTMHAAHLSREDLRGLETAIWGDAKNGAALALSICREGKPEPELFDYKNRSGPKPEFTRAHDLQEPKGKKTTQGLFYVSYGMDDGPQGERRQRYYVQPDARWTLTLSARSAAAPKDGSIIPADEVLHQGEGALWLLCRYGGIGSKARKGFGSFSDIDAEGIASVGDCKRRGASIRSIAGLAESPGDPVRSSRLEEMLSLEVETPWRDWWFALDQLGFAIQSFAQENAHRERKYALGLPRRIHRPPKPLSANDRQRHASPVHYHLAPQADGTLTVRMTAFPSPDLPDINTSREVLTELKGHLASELKASIQEHANRGTRKPAAARPPASAGDQALVSDSVPRPGDCVEAVLLEERTRKGGWKARHEPTGLQGPIQNTKDVPDTAEPGQRISLIVAFAQREMAFTWPTPAARARQSKTGGGRGRQSGRSGRPPKTRR